MHYCNHDGSISIPKLILIPQLLVRLKSLMGRRKLPLFEKWHESFAGIMKSPSLSAFVSSEQSLAAGSNLVFMLSLNDMFSCLSFARRLRFLSAMQRSKHSLRDRSSCDLASATNSLSFLSADCFCRSSISISSCWLQTAPSTFTFSSIVPTTWSTSNSNTKRSTTSVPPVLSPTPLELFDATTSSSRTKKTMLEATPRTTLGTATSRNLEMYCETCGTRLA